MTTTYQNQNSTPEKRTTQKDVLLRTGYSSKGRRHHQLQMKTHTEVSKPEEQSYEDTLLDALKKPLEGAKYLNVQDEFIFSDRDINSMTGKSPERHLRLKKSESTLAIELEHLATELKIEQGASSKRAHNSFLDSTWAELLALEEKQLDSMFTLFQVFLDPRMQLLRNNTEIRTLLRQYIRIQTELKKLLSALDKKKSVYEQCATLYNAKFMQYQKNLARLLPELLFLDELLRLSWSKKHIQEALEKVSLLERLKTKLRLYLGHEQDKSIQEIISEGKVALSLVQLMSLRVHKLAVIYGSMPVGVEWVEKIQSITEESSRITTFALNLTVKPAFKLDDKNDTQGLRRILCDDIRFSALERRVDAYGLEAIKCLHFLRDLSCMIEMGVFWEYSPFASSSAFVMKLKTLETMDFLLQAEEKKMLQDASNRREMAKILLVLLKRAFDVIKEPIVHFVSAEKKMEESVDIEKKGEKKEIVSNDRKKKSHRKPAVVREIKFPGVDAEKSALLDKQCHTRSIVYGPHPMTSMQFEAMRDIRAQNSARTVLRAVLFAAPFIALAAIPFVGPIVAILAFSLAAVVSAPMHVAVEKNLEHRKEEYKKLSKNRYIFNHEVQPNKEGLLSLENAAAASASRYKSFPELI
jgi:hypothetical protein